MYTVATPRTTLIFDKRANPKISEIIIARADAQTIWPVVIQMPLSNFGEKVIKNSK